MFSQMQDVGLRKGMDGANAAPMQQQLFGCSVAVSSYVP